MKTLKLLVVVLGAGCVLGAAAVIGQHKQLQELHAEAARLLTGPETPLSSPQAQAPVDSSSQASPALTHELLQLRNRVSRLRKDHQELAGIQAEHERLLAEVAAAKTNAPDRALPRGYIRKATAQLVGQATPEETVQKFLWSVRNRDVTNLVQTLTPASAKRFGGLIGADGADQFFKEAGGLPGLGLGEPQANPDGSLTIRMQVVPDMPGMEVHFEQIEGQWKMDIPH